MKKIDILNFITNHRKSPNDTKTYSELHTHLKVSDDELLSSMLDELKHLKVVKELEK